MTGELRVRLVLRGKDNIVRSFINDNTVNNHLQLDLMKLNTSVVSTIYTIGKFEGNTFIDFWTMQKMPMEWLEDMSEKYPNLQFEMVWYHMKSEQYQYCNIFREKQRGIIENYVMDKMDLEFFDEDDETLPRDIEYSDMKDTIVGERCSGRFSAILARVGLYYEMKF